MKSRAPSYFLSVLFCVCGTGLASSALGDAPPHVFFAQLKASDRTAFHRYAFDESKLAALERFAALANARRRTDKNSRVEWQRYGDTEAPEPIVQGNVEALTRRYPMIRKAIVDAGLRCEDYPLGVMTITMALWVTPPVPAEDAVAAKSVLSQESIRFVQAHAARCKRLVAQLN